MIDLHLICIDDETQARAELNQDTVAEYAEAYKAGAEFPAVKVFFDGTHRWLADGYHRYFAAKAAGKTSIFESIEPGTKRDAILYSVKANTTHGLRRTNADKRKAVLRLLNDSEWSAWSDRKIADYCHVTHPFVAGIRTPKVVTVTTQQPNHKPQPVEPDTIIASGKPATKREIEPYTPMAESMDDMDAVQILSEENDRLNDRLAVVAMDATEDERAAAAVTLSELRAQVKTLTAELDAVKASRDSYMQENKEMKNQLGAQRRQLDKIKK